MMQRALTSSCVCLALLSLPALARAQGTLSTQGFGYPTGEMSTRALGAGGATSDFDAFSSSNPASIAASLGSMLYVQMEPEYRHLTNDNGGKDNVSVVMAQVLDSFPARSGMFDRILQWFS